MVLSFAKISPIPIANTVSQNTFTVVPGTNYRLEIIGSINVGGGAGNQKKFTKFNKEIDPI